MSALTSAPAGQAPGQNHHNDPKTGDRVTWMERGPDQLATGSARDPGWCLPANPGQGGNVKIVVDLAVCQGYAQCAFLAPDAFRIYGEEALLYDPQPEGRLEERVLQAAAACPVQAIAVDLEQR